MQPQTTENRYVKQTIYGAGTPVIDCVILCQHGDDGEEFVRNHAADLERLCSRHDFQPSRHDPALFQQYLQQYYAIEPDVGSSELAHEIARIMEPRLDDHQTVVVVDIRIPRAIIDANRVRDHALRPVFDYQGRDAIAERFLAIHGSASMAVKEVLDRIHDKGIVIDVHSMAPYSPNVQRASNVQAVSLSPTTLAEYVRSYTDQSMRGERRSIDIVTTLENGTLIANEALANTCAREFGEARLPFQFNHPYPTNETVMTTRYMRRYRTLAVDVPKDYLAATPGAVEFDLTRLQPAEELVKRVAMPIANAATHCLNDFMCAE